LRGDPRRVLELAERGLAIDKLNEALWRLAMEADSAAGLRDSVSQRYAQLRKLLDQELGLEPSIETRGIYFELLAQR
jgi:DNA-binding SARP family transcriptional activator